MLQSPDIVLPYFNPVMISISIILRVDNLTRGASSYSSHITHSFCKTLEHIFKVINTLSVIHKFQGDVSRRS